jgi:predicted enzyme related to lactoylglutathione lyase
MLKDCEIGSIVFFVARLDRAVAFYRDTLGLAVEVVEGGEGAYAIAQTGGIVLVFIPREARAGDSPVIVFAIPGGIDDYADALAAKGVEIVVPVSECPDGGLSVDFVDPDRNVLSIYQPAGAARRK